MAALIKVNNIQAYALLDSGSTAVSITHNFVRVAKLKLVPLAMPVTLQLGTVGSRAMINYSSLARVEFGLIIQDVYMDIINIDWYNMIISTLFMREHELVLDFAKNSLLVKGQVILLLIIGQEDLMLAKKQV